MEIKFNNAVTSTGEIVNADDEHAVISELSILFPKPGHENIKDKHYKNTNELNLLFDVRMPSNGILYYLGDYIEYPESKRNKFTDIMKFADRRIKGTTVCEPSSMEETYNICEALKEFAEGTQKIIVRKCLNKLAADGEDPDEWAKKSNREIVEQYKVVRCK